MGRELSVTHTQTQKERERACKGGGAEGEPLKRTGKKQNREQVVAFSLQASKNTS